MMAVDRLRPSAHWTSMVGTAEVLCSCSRSLQPMTVPAATPMLDAKQPIRADDWSMKVERGVPGERKFSTKTRLKAPAGGKRPDVSSAAVAEGSGVNRLRVMPCMLPSDGPLPINTPSPQSPLHPEGRGTVAPRTPFVKSVP